MHESGSTILTMIERGRALVDAPSTKWSDTYIVDHVIGPELVNVWSRLALDFQNPPLLHYDIALKDGTRHYQLPPTIGEIWEICERNDDGTIKRRIDCRSSLHPAGPGWRIEANTLTFEPEPDLDETWTVLYMPNGDFRAHFSKTGRIGSDGSSSSSSSVAGRSAPENRLFTLGSTTVVGRRDQRPNGYGGGILRILRTVSESVTVHEEHLIESHDPVEGRLVLRTPITYYDDGDEVWYEVVPAGLQAFVHAVSVKVALSLGVHKDVSRRKMDELRLMYRDAKKSVADNLTNMNQRQPHHFERDTVHNPNRGIWFLGE